MQATFRNRGRADNDNTLEIAQIIFRPIVMCFYLDILQLTEFQNILLTQITSLSFVIEKKSCCTSINGNY